MKTSNGKIKNTIQSELDKRGWALIRTKKIKPTGYIGYEFTLYEKDDFTVEIELRAKTVKGIWKKIYKFVKEYRKL